jgi:hypothetical protein
MLPPRRLKKLRYGNIIYAEVPSSDGTYNAGAHWSIILDRDEAIEESDALCVVTISTNVTKERRFLVPVPTRVGLTGNVICSWLPDVPKNEILDIHPERLDEAEMFSIEQMINRYLEGQRG